MLDELEEVLAGVSDSKRKVMSGRQAIGSAASAPLNIVTAWLEAGGRLTRWRSTVWPRLEISLWRSYGWLRVRSFDAQYPSSKRRFLFLLMAETTSRLS